MDLQTVADPGQIPMPKNWREVEERLIRAEQVINELPAAMKPGKLKSGHPEIVREKSKGDYPTPINLRDGATPHEISQAFEASEWPALLIRPDTHKNRQKAKLIRTVITFKVKVGTHVDWFRIKGQMGWYAAKRNVVRMRYQRALADLTKKL